jgi:hypothetical protein
MNLPQETISCQVIIFYDKIRIALIAGILTLVAISISFPWVFVLAFALPYFSFRIQDLPILPMVVIFLLIRPKVLRSVDKLPLLSSPRQLVPMAALLILLVCWAGHQWALMGLDLSRDEQLANFDAFIYGHGAVVWPIPSTWRPYAAALNQMYIQSVGDHDAWVSGYLPVNAAARAMFAKLGMIDVTGPAFVLLGFLCIWKVARKLWPDEGFAPLVAAGLYTCSSQILITGMTAYAMNAHVGLNLLWLLLFLRGGRTGHGGAILVGFLATGIHQPLFHPLFVLPFLDQLRRERRWTTLGAYCLAYAAIGAVWAAWPLWIGAHGVTQIPPGEATAAVGYIDRFLSVISFDPRVVVLMAINLIRFITWQHLLLLPLMTLGIVVGWRRDPIARSLAIGLVLPLLAVTVLTPYQGHGWGYRYLHGVIGSTCLLATGGYVWLRSRGLSIAKPMIWATAISLLLVFPVHLVMAHRQIAPIARVDAAIRTSTADILVLDDIFTPFALDLVINQPDLSNRPLRLAGRMLDPSQMAVLCRGHVLTFLDAPRLAGINAMFGLTGPLKRSPHQDALEQSARTAGCRIRSFI